MREKRLLLNTRAKEPLKKITKSKKKKLKCNDKKNNEVHTMANKITERDIYTDILNGTIDMEILKVFAEKKIAQLDKRNASAKARAEKRKAAGDELMNVVFTFVSDEAKTRAQITAELVAEGYDVTEGKVGARLNKLVANGQVAKAKGRVAGENGKTKAATLYTIAA